MKRREIGVRKKDVNRRRPKSLPTKNKIVTGWRRRAFFLVCIVFIPSFILIFFEICLRILDFGYPADFYLKRTFDRKTFYTENEKFGWRFFPRNIARRPCEQIVSASKDQKLVRVSLLGGSAAMGDPDPSFGFARILEAIMNARYPDKRFEVINAAMTGINSHVVREIARDSLALKPDFFIIYAGNNEVVGPFGAGTAFSSFSGSMFLIRLKSWIETTRIGQTLNSFGNLLRKGEPQNAVWGMNLFLKHRIPLSDKRLNMTYRHFKKNLSDICQTARQSGAKTILCSVAVNLRSCPPFASLRSTSFTESQNAEWRQYLHSGIEKENDGKYDEAILFYRKALMIDHAYAELHFRLGNCLLEKGEIDEARRHFILARDLDGLRFRADSEIDKVIREVARDKGVILADVADVIQNASGNNIPGDDLFYDHVHLNFSGNYRAARLLADVISDVIPQSPSGEFPDESRCADLLAFTPFDQRRILNLMLGRMSLPPFTNQMNHPQMIERAERQLRRYEIHEDSPALRESMTIYRKALKENPEDWRLFENFAHLLQNTERASEEADMWRAVIRLLPHHRERWASLGQALARKGSFLEAVRACETALKRDSRNPTAHNGLGMAYAGLKNPEKAMAHYHEALRLKPDYLDARHNLGTLLSSIGRSEEAIRLFSSLVSLNPHDPDAHFNLGVESAKMKDYQNAESHFIQALRADPNHAEALYNLGFISTEKGDLDQAVDYYLEALEINPEYANAHNNLGALYARISAFSKAIEHFSEVLRINPENQEIHYNLGLAYSSQGESEKALDHFARLLEAFPDHARGHFHLGVNLEKIGRDEDALQHFRKARDLTSDQTELAKEIMSRIELYEQGRPSFQSDEKGDPYSP